MKLLLQYKEETQAKGHLIGGLVSRNENQGNDLILYTWQGTHLEIPVTRVSVQKGSHFMLQQK